MWKVTWFVNDWFQMFLWVVLEVALIYYSIALYGLSSLLKDMEEDEMDGLPSKFSDSDCGFSMVSDNDALPEAFYNFLQSRGFDSPAAFGTWMHLKILETKKTAYLACYLRISKPTLYKYMRLVDLNWRGPSTSEATMLQNTMRLRGTWSAVGVLQLGALYVGHQHVTRIMLAVGGKDIEDLPRPFLSNVECATLSEAHGIVPN
ncbi:hypothetical protein SELMODRAFT_404838 [Selaginella moellendorffii]|uniref:Uncharacterized protein n=1 Tax=Selaginella moellendorffii TaxID=88036 RepID=D8QXI7_SELML|nr:hypothetical protein SELMODRAFT_404838 [Selaginella moellendorffii]